MTSFSTYANSFPIGKHRTLFVNRKRRFLSSKRLTCAPLLWAQQILVAKTRRGFHWKSHSRSNSHECAGMPKLGNWNFTIYMQENLISIFLSLFLFWGGGGGFSLSYILRRVWWLCHKKDFQQDHVFLGLGADDLKKLEGLRNWKQVASTTTRPYFG